MNEGLTVNSEIFVRLLCSRIALKHICDFKNSRHGDLPISVENRVVEPIREVSRK